MSEPWVNLSNQNGDQDVVAFVRPDGLERVHVYVRANGSFGLRNFFRRDSDSDDLWEVGSEWGHNYDSASTAVEEAAAHFPWLSELVSRRSGETRDKPTAEEPSASQDQGN